MPPLLSSRLHAPLAAVLLAAGSCALALGSGQPPRAARAAGRAAPIAAYECRFTEKPLVIDGIGRDAAWKDAVLIDRFSMPWAGKAPLTNTKARLLWDRENLYFLAELEDHDLFADIREHDGMTWLNDVIELFFKPADDKPGYYELQVNAANTLMDMFLPRRGDGGYDRYVRDGDFHWEAKVSLRGTLNQRHDRDRGWTVEGRIPWKDFLRTGGRPAVGEQWKFALCRYDYTLGKEPELSTCAPLTKPSFHRSEDYSTIRFVGARQASRPYGIDRLVPLTTSTVAGSPDPPLPFRIRRVYPKLKLTYPEILAHEPGSAYQLAIIQQWPGGPSKLIRFKDDPETNSFETLLSVDRCAYDICFHPGFARNRYVFLSSKGPLSAEGPDRKMQVARYTLRPDGAIEPGSEKVIIDWPSDGHDGGGMGFGTDGMFYVTTGDGTSDSDKNIAGQDMTRLTAKLLRLDLEHPGPGRAYSVPKDNPFVGREGIRPETWAYGFRNPWRMTVDRPTGQIWVGNNGQDLWETAYLIERGANYGWSVYEGSHPFYLNRKLGPTPLVNPTVEHPHSEARSLTGGLVYHGSRFPELRDAYVYGDYSTGKIWAVKHDGRRILWHRELASTTLQITGFGAGSRGELLITDMRGNGEGGFYELEPTPKDLPPSTFPRTLSAGGLFRSVKGHLVQPGLIPYSVNSPLWSDGAYKERYIALPASDPHIDFTTSRGWNFPDRTVLVKSFAVETEEGNPKSRQWVETRFLTRQDGQWAGYSYRWNEEQTEAALVDKEGQDRDVTVRVPRSAEHPDGLRKQVWHYPSRAECMVCHSRAANFVLGPSLLQMNRERRYGRVRDNQLRVLEHLGVLRVDWAAEAQEALRQEARAKGLKEPEVDEYVRKQSASDGQRQPGAASLLALSPEKYPHLVDPADRKQDLSLRARSYLHANCAQCHVEAGGGNAQMELEFTTPPKGMRVFDTKPLHDTFGLSGPRLIAAGSPDRSVLLHRISMRDKGFMPPLATRVVDRNAVELLREWIRRLPPDTGK